MKQVISDNQKLVKSKVLKSRKNLRTGARGGRIGPPHFVPLTSLGWAPTVARAPLRERTAALARSRSIWPLGRVTQISPIHSSLTPLIGLALKLVRLTSVADLPRSMVFK